MISSHRLVIGSAQFMKQLNRSTILTVIRDKAAVSRAEIAKITGLTSPTVTNLVTELIDEGLVVEGKRGQSSGGRKPILLKINPQARFILGVDIGVTRMRIVVVDLNATIKCRVERDLPSRTTSESFLQCLGDTIDDALQSAMMIATLRIEKLLGIGVGMHGLVDASRGVALFAPHLQLHNVDIRGYLNQRFGVPVLVDNDVRAMAIGERWFGKAQDISDFVYINVGYGLGSAIVIRNELHSGVSGSAGEIGHTVIDEFGPVCNCGKRGCLEVLSAGSAIASRAVAAIERGEHSVIEQLVHGDITKITGLIVYEAACKGDELATTILGDAGRYLGICIANLINILNPQAIIVGGGVANAGDFIFDEMRRIVQKHSLQVPLSATKIVNSSLGANGAAIGAASMVLETIFTPD